MLPVLTFTPKRWLFGRRRLVLAHLVDDALQQHLILALDADFQVYRLHGRTRFEIVPPPEFCELRLAVVSELVGRNRGYCAPELALLTRARLAACPRHQGVRQVLEAAHHWRVRSRQRASPIACCIPAKAMISTDASAPIPISIWSIGPAATRFIIIRI